jgi:CubicO group peptidase (beta-lactamase class C family)
LPISTELIAVTIDSSFAFETFTLVSCPTVRDEFSMHDTTPADRVRRPHRFRPGCRAPTFCRTIDRMPDGAPQLPYSRWRLRGAAALAGLLLFGATAGLPADDLAERLRAAVPDGFSGQVVVATPDRVLFAGAFGEADRERSLAVQADTLFDIGSITKTFTAAMILQLAAEGRLTPAQALGGFFEGLPEETAAITLHQLLTHTSGLPQYSGDDDDPRTAESFDAWLAATRPEFPPGDHYAYSNPGYSALARIVEKLTGESYEEQLQTRVVEPLGLGPLGYRAMPDTAVQAVAYDGDRPVGHPTEMNWLSDGPGWNLRGNGGLLTNAASLARWLQAVAQGRVLPPEWQERQLERHAAKGDDSWYGYGWGVDQRDYGEVVGHTGGNGYFFALAFWYRDHDLLLAVTNNAFDREQAGLLLGNLRRALELEPAAAEGRVGQPQ